MSDDASTIDVSRRVAAPAHHVFVLVSHPRHHAEFDGSGMLRGPVDDRPIEAVGDTFTMRMHRMGRDYQMINHVVAFEPERLVVWEPAPGDVDTAGGDESRIGVPSGYQWGYRLAPDGDDATVLTSTFSCGPDGNAWILERDGGEWINGHTTVRESMAQTLERIATLCESGDADYGAGSPATS